MNENLHVFKKPKVYENQLPFSSINVQFIEYQFKDGWISIETIPKKNRLKMDDYKM